MKRTYDESDDESYESMEEEEEIGDDDDDQEEEEYYDQSLKMVYRLEREEGLARGTTTSRDDRPFLLPPNHKHDTTETSNAEYFTYHPKDMQVDPLSTGSLVTGISPYGSTMGTLEYNLRHAIENRDEARMTACLTEFFRHFVLLNRPMKRFVSKNLERQSRLDMLVAVGPFANPASFAMHQRLMMILMGICVRQIGIASPTAFSFFLDEWKVYERVLFHRPALALAKLVGIGVTFCHCKKDASVAYTRHVFEDSSKMREWRNDVLKRPEIVSTYIPNADQAYKARKMLLCNKVYFNNRLRLRRYQAVCIGTPHPEYMCQGGSMHRSHVLKLVDAVKQSIPSEAGPDASAVIQDMEDAMIYLASHVNNVYDRDVFETLQVDLQIFLYLFQRILSETPRALLQGPDALLYTSKVVVSSAANQLTEAYAQRLWDTCPDMIDLIKYGIQGEPILKSSRRGGGGGGGGKKRGSMTINDLVDTFQPEIIPKIHEWAPPSICRDEDNVSRECMTSEIQRHPSVQSFRFLFGLYRLHRMWTKCTSSKLCLPQEPVMRMVVDREFFDIKQPYRTLYQCTATGICAVEVCLKGNAAAELKASGTNPKDNLVGHQEIIPTTDFGEAEVFADHLCRPDDTGGHKPLKAVLVGPWSVQECGRLQIETQRNQIMKETLGVYPDMVFVKKMMLLDFTIITGDTKPDTHILGRTYAWVVYIPSRNTNEHHVLMTIDDLKKIASQDLNLAKTAKSILRPKYLVRPVAIMKRTCGEFCNWKIGDNYVSFDVETCETSIVLKNIRMHTIAETLLGKCPDYRYSKMSDVKTMNALQNIIQTCRSKAQYVGANTELAHCETLLNQLS